MNIVTRQDVADLLKSIGKPGEKRDQKIKAIKDLEMKNSQGHALENTLDTYKEF
jgi:hypothetical protein